MTTQHTGGYLIVYEKEFGDFVLKCDVKMEPVLQFGESSSASASCAIPCKPASRCKWPTTSAPATTTSARSYDLVPPKKFDKPLSPEWNTIQVTCKGSLIDVEVNGQHVAQLNCDEWPVPHQGPNGHRNKFSRAMTDFPRKGSLGFQDHGHKVWFKNVKLLELSGK